MRASLRSRWLLGAKLVLDILARSLAIAHPVEVTPPERRMTQILAMPPESFPARRLIHLTACAPDWPIAPAKRMRQRLQEQQSQQPEQEPERPVSSPPSVCPGSQPGQSCA